MDARSRIIAAAGLMAVLLTAGWAQAGAIQFNDVRADQQWYLQHARFNQAWARLQRQPTRGQVTVAVIDTGVDLGHADLQRSPVRGINITNRRRNVRPVHPHGTATTGLVGATSGNAIGITGAAWTSRVMPIRVTNRPSGAAYLSDLARAVRWAADHGAQVISVSYGGVHRGIMARAAKYAQQRGATVFMAAGNHGRAMRRWPNHRHLIAVGSVRPDGQLSSFSSRGRFVDLVAPGEDILTLYPGGYAVADGTSFATPLAASVAALMLTANPDLAPWQVRSLLIRSARDLGRRGRDNAYGHGLINADRAVAMALRTRGHYAGRGRRPVRTVPADWDTYAGTYTFINGTSAGGLVRAEGTLEAVAVPEPGPAAMMLLLGAAALLRRGRPTRRRGHPPMERLELHARRSAQPQAGAERRALQAASPRVSDDRVALDTRGGAPGLALSPLVPAS